VIRGQGGEAIAVEANVLEAPDVQRIVEKTLSTFGRIDVLFNNVGGGWGTDIINTTEEQWDRTFDVCVKSIFLVSKQVVPKMREAGGGVIINNASISALKYDVLWAYDAAKAAVIKLTKDMAYRYGRHNIRVNCVAPGLIDTALGRLGVAKDEKAAEKQRIVARETVPLGRQGTPEEVAQAVLFLASEEASYCSGSCLVVDGGFTCQ
jgi:NAD(P)-dependent dehydrogenase (short-subunit alcohol dehydrogenase family)